MATYHECDRCGRRLAPGERLYPTYLGEDFSLFLGHLLNRTDSSDVRSEGEFCPTCISEFREFLKPPAKPECCGNPGSFACNENCNP